MKIASKITISFIIVVTIFAAVSLLTFYIAAKAQLEETIYAHLNTTAQSRARHIETFLEIGKESVEQLSKSIVIEQFLSAGKNDKDYNGKIFP